MRFFYLLFFPFLFSACKENRAQTVDQLSSIAIVQEQNNTPLTRFNCPENYQRVSVDKNSFAEYLRNLPLKSPNVLVKYYNGTLKENNNIYSAVVDLAIGDKDLHQCADAVMRLRAEYLWSQKRYQDIGFNLTNGMTVPYEKWMNGYRVKVNGNKTSWVKSHTFTNSYNDFWNYLEFIFMYAGTYSLSKELKEKSLKDIGIGDVFIQGGFPGHAIIVIDMAIDKSTDRKMFMLAQSYMPAQEIQILKNTEELGPWFSIDNNMEVLYTPEWTFYSNDLKKF